MKHEVVAKINREMENQFGAGGITLTDDGCFAWGDNRIGQADYETLHELIYELTVLKDHIESNCGLQY